MRTGHAFNGVTGTSYQLSDHLGSISYRLNENGKVIDAEEYYPFGDSSVRTWDNDHKRYRYVGKEKDAESGLYYYGARYYSAWTCRFISVDPLIGETFYQSSFAYADNNPVMMNDPTGAKSEDGNEPQNSNATQGTTTHNVVEGDTLSELAVTYGTSIKEIVHANGNKIKSIHHIEIGWELNIPTSDHEKNDFEGVADALEFISREYDTSLLADPDFKLEPATVVSQQIILELKIFVTIGAQYVKDSGARGLTIELATGKVFEIKETVVIWDKENGWISLDSWNEVKKTIVEGFELKSELQARSGFLLETGRRDIGIKRTTKLDTDGNPIDQTTSCHLGAPFFRVLFEEDQATDLLTFHIGSQEDWNISDLFPPGVNAKFFYAIEFVDKTIVPENTMEDLIKAGGQDIPAGLLHDYLQIRHFYKDIENGKF